MAQNKCNEIAFAVLLKNLDSAECVQAFFDSGLHLKADKTGFAIDLWFCAKELPEDGKEAVLLSGGGLSLLLSGGSLKMKYQDKECSLAGKVSPFLWHNAAVSFSNGEMVGFYDGVTVYSGGEDFTDMDIQVDKWELGKGFCGFLKGLRVFSQALSRDRLCAVLYKEPDEEVGEEPDEEVGEEPDEEADGDASLEAWYVFTQNPPAEKVHQYTIVLKQASFTDFSSQIRFSGNTVFKYSDSDMGTSKEYTLLLRIYPDTPKAARQGIFSRTVSRTEDRVSLYLSSEQDQFYFEAEIGGSTSGSLLTIKGNKISTGDLCRWYTVALVLREDSCSLWVNGKASEENQGFTGVESFCHMVYLGTDGTGSQAGITGYISYGAEFTSCLSMEQIEAYAKTPPFVFDKSIHSLFHPVQNLSSGELLREEVTGNALESADASFCLASRTAGYYTTETMSYSNSGQAFSANAYQAWRTEFFCRLCELFFSNMYGVSPSSGYTKENSLLAETGERMAADYVQLPEFDSVLLQAGFDVTDSLESLFGRLAESDFLNLYTRMFFMDRYFKQNALYTMSLEFLRAVFVSGKADENYQNAFNSFVGQASSCVSEVLAHKQSYQDDTLSVSVQSASLNKDGEAATLTVGLSYTLTGADRSAEIVGWSDPRCFRGSTEPGKVTFSSGNTAAVVELEVKNPRKIEQGKKFSFAIQFDNDKQYFLDYFTQSDFPQD